MIQLTIFSIVMWMLSFIYPAQNDLIIIDKATKEPLAGVMITTNDKNYYTDLYGKMQMTPDIINKTIQIKYISYETVDTVMYNGGTIELSNL